MIKGSAYIQKAPRLSLYNVADTVTEIHPGQLFHLNDDSEWVYADGTRKSYPTLNSRYAGLGIGAQGERLEGRDDVSRVGKITVLLGNYEIETDQYDKTETYTPGMALVAKDGVVTPFNEGTDKPHLIVGYVTVAPTVDNEFITYHG